MANLALPEIAKDLGIDQQGFDFFNSLWNNVDTFDGYFPAKSAVTFLETSGLNHETLGQVWSLSDTIDPKGFLSRSEFFTACKLVALAQHQVPLLLENLAVSAPLPKLGTVDLLTATPSTTMPPTPTLTLFGLDESESNVDDEMVDDKGANDIIKTVTDDANVAALGLTPNDLCTFATHWTAADTVDGNLKYNTAVSFLRTSGLDQDILSRIWGLSDTIPPKGQLSKPEFYKACKFVALAQKGLPLTTESLKLVTSSPRIGAEADRSATEDEDDDEDESKDDNDTVDNVVVATQDDVAVPKSSDDDGYMVVEPVHLNNNGTASTTIDEDDYIEVAALDANTDATNTTDNSSNVDNTNDDDDSNENNDGVDDNTGCFPERTVSGMSIGSAFNNGKSIEDVDSPLTFMDHEQVERKLQSLSEQHGGLSRMKAFAMLKVAYSEGNSVTNLNDISHTISNGNGYTTLTIEAVGVRLDDMKHRLGVSRMKGLAMLKNGYTLNTPLDTTSTTPRDFNQSPSKLLRVEFNDFRDASVDPDGLGGDKDKDNGRSDAHTLPSSRPLAKLSYEDARDVMTQREQRDHDKTPVNPAHVENIEKLVGMGFAAKDAAVSLEKVANNLERAIDDLLTKPKHSDPNVDLYTAVTNKDLPGVKAALKNGAEVDWINPNTPQWYCALIQAVRKGFTQGVQHLLDYGANIEIRSLEGWTPLLHAAKHGKYEVAKILLDSGANAQHEGRDLDGTDKTAEQFAQQQNHIRLRDLIQERRALEVDDLLLNIPANIKIKHDPNLDMALYEAINTMSIRDAERALKDGANPDWVNPETTNKIGCLIQAVYKNFVPGVKLLIAYGADVDLSNPTGWTPLVQAGYSNRLVHARLLLEAGADVGAKGIDSDKSYKTAEEFAAKNGHALIRDEINEWNQKMLNKILTPGIVPPHVSIRGTSESQALIQEALKKLPEVLAGNQLVRSLRIVNCNMDDATAVAIFTALQTCPNIKRVDVSQNKIGNAGAFAVWEFIKTCPTLEEVNLSENIIGDESVSSLPDFITIDVETLKVIDIQDNPISFQKMREIEKTLKNLVKLGNPKANEQLFLAVSQSSIEGMEQAFLGGADPDCISPSSKHRTPCLVSAVHKDFLAGTKLLIARGCDVDLESPTGWTALVQAGYSNRLQHARVLLDSGANSDARGVDADKKTYRTAAEFATRKGHHAVANLIKSRALARPRESVDKILTEECVPDNVIIQGNMKKDSSVQPVTKQEIRKSIAALPSIVPMADNLKSIRLTHCDITDAEAIVLFEALTLNKTIERVDLSNNNIGDAGALAAWKFMKSSPGLVAVDLSSNGISDQGVEGLAEAVMGNTSSVKLVSLLFNTSITDRKVSEVRDQIQAFDLVIKFPDSGANMRLFEAVSDQNLDKMRLALQQGADVNWVNPASTNKIGCLIQAVYKDFIAGTKMLIDAGCNVDLCNPTGWTALVQAGYSGRLEHARALLEGGAGITCAGIDADKRTKRTGAEFATQKGHFEVAELINLHAILREIPNTITVQTVAGDQYKLINWKAEDNGKEVLPELIAHYPDLCSHVEEISVKGDPIEEGGDHVELFTFDGIRDWAVARAKLKIEKKKKEDTEAKAKEKDKDKDTVDEDSDAADDDNLAEDEEESLALVLLFNEMIHMKVVPCGFAVESFEVDITIVGKATLEYAIKKISGAMPIEFVDEKFEIYTVDGLAMLAFPHTTQLSTLTFKDNSVVEIAPIWKTRSELEVKSAEKDEDGIEQKYTLATFKSNTKTSSVCAAFLKQFPICNYEEEIKMLARGHSVETFADVERLQPACMVLERRPMQTIIVDTSHMEEGPEGGKLELSVTTDKSTVLYLRHRISAALGLAAENIKLSVDGQDLKRKLDKTLLLSTINVATGISVSSKKKSRLSLFNWK
eukprot:m.121520 g.121520  ORF g.121520 m.121520 type:complete len:1909 (+) comp28862_c0_seq1:110-5836(+)